MKLSQMSLSKLSQPILPKVLKRTRLFTLLEKGRSSPVTWVSGPAGSGKTTLVASWIYARKMPCLWYRLDTGDSDSATFFYYLGIAAGKAAPHCKRPLPLLTPEYSQGIAAFTRRFFEDLAGRIKPSSVIVFDNYQDVPLSSPMHEIIRMGLSVLPEGVRVIVMSRAGPPQTFVHLLAGNKLLMVGWTELQLTPKESRGIIKLQGIGKSKFGLHEWLLEKTSGWAAGVVLLGRMIKTETLDTRRLSGLEPQQVFDYFASELFDKADKGTQDFLLMTSVLPVMTPALAKQLTGNREAGRILSELNQRNYFTEKLNQRELTYKYHPLFREFLLARLATTLSPETVLRTRRAAAHLLAASGRVEDASDLLIAAGEWEGLADVIIRHGRALMGQGRSRTLEVWLAAMPGDLVEKNPWLLYWSGLSKIMQNPVESNIRLERAFSLFDKAGDRAGVFLAWAGAVDSILLQFDRLDRLDRWFAVFKRLVKRYKKIPDPGIEGVTALTLFSALTIRTPNHPDAPLWRDRALALARQLGDIDLLARITFQTAWKELFVGKAHKAGSLLADLEKRARQLQSVPTQAMIFMLLSISDWLDAKNDKCQQDVALSLKLAEISGAHAWDYIALGSGVTSALSEGDMERAGTLINRMEAALPRTSAMDKAYYYNVAAWHAVLKGDLRGALRFAQEGVLVSGSVGAPFPLALGNLAAAAVCQEMHDAGQASLHLRRARTIASRMEMPALLFMCRLFEAQTHFDSGKETAGARALAKAMTIGRDQGYVNMYWWRPKVMSRLCVKALEHGIETEYVRKLIQQRDLAPEEPMYDLENWPWLVKVRTLGRFELTVKERPDKFSGKVQKKPLELLMFLIAQGGDEAGEEQITDALWPDAEGDAGRQLLKITLHRLRGILGSDKALILHEGRLGLDRRYVWVDAWAFERVFQNVECGLRNSELKESKKINKNDESEINELEKAIQRYRGHFLGEERERTWAVSYRERLQCRFLRVVLALGDHWERKGAFDKARRAYERGLEIDDLAEEFYQRLMKCCGKRGLQSEAARVYERCTRILAANLGVEPAAETESIYAAVMRK